MQSDDLEQSEPLNAEQLDGVAPEDIEEQPAEKTMRLWWQQRQAALPAVLAELGDKSCSAEEAQYILGFLRKCQSITPKGVLRVPAYARAILKAYPGLRRFHDPSEPNGKKDIVLGWNSPGKFWYDLTPRELSELVTMFVKLDGDHTNSAFTRRHADTLKELLEMMSIRCGQNVDAIDADPYLILDKDGACLDLSTQHITEQSEDKPLMRRLPAAYDVVSATRMKLWPECLKQWTRGDKELERYLQRMVGYSLLANNDHHLFLFFLGHGGSGKSAFLKTWQALLGDHWSMPCKVDVFLAKGSDNEERLTIDAMRNKRLVVLSDMSDESMMDTSTIKSLTGDGKLSARGHHQAYSSFKATALLVGQGNTPPIFTDSSSAMERRLRIIEFRSEITEIDYELEEKLLAELDGILWWALDGLGEFLANGEQPPDEVLQSTEQSLGENTSYAKQWAINRLENVPAGGEAVTLAEAHRDFLCYGLEEQWFAKKKYISEQTTPTPGYTHNHTEVEPPKHWRRPGFERDLKKFLHIVATRGEGRGATKQKRIEGKRLVRAAAAAQPKQEPKQEQPEVLTEW